MLTIKLKPELEKKAKKLIGENSDEFFEKIINIEILETKKAIKNLQNDLRFFEKKYSMDTKVFYTKWENGELGDANDDFFEWSGEYEIFLKVKDKLENLLS